MHSVGFRRWKRGETLNKKQSGIPGRDTGAADTLRVTIIIIPSYDSSKHLHNTVPGTVLFTLLISLYLILTAAL